MYEVLFHDQCPAYFQLRHETRVGFLRHHDHDVGLRDVRIEDRLVGEQQLRAARATTCFGTEVLRHCGVGALVDRGGFAQNDGGEDHALSAESDDAKFL